MKAPNDLISAANRSQKGRYELRRWSSKRRRAVLLMEKTRKNSEKDRLFGEKSERGGREEKSPVECEAPRQRANCRRVGPLWGLSGRHSADGTRTIQGWERLNKALIARKYDYAHILDAPPPSSLRGPTENGGERAVVDFESKKAGHARGTQRRRRAVRREREGRGGREDE